MDVNIKDFLNQIDSTYYWVFVFASSFIENIFPPYPGDTVTVLGGYLVGTQKFGIWELISAVFIGSMSSAMIMYFFGKNVISFFTRTLQIKFFQSFIDSGSMEKTEKWFKKYGIYAVIFSRFSAAIRFFIAIIAGATKMNIFTFLLAFALATALFNSLLIYGGYLLGENWELLIEYIKLYNMAFMGICALAIAYWIIHKYIIKRKIQKS